uniref:Uncharacterized protein TCIL3000_5_2000 n=1 Tax=Trypanosoma congolense (strain IL3000) TaxID=1068625 RepID=G0UMT5_TRYCI|nr:unnamed protein product [Trypanosoma congolense IL3000]
MGGPTFIFLFSSGFRSILYISAGPIFPSIFDPFTFFAHCFTVSIVVCLFVCLFVMYLLLFSLPLISFLLTMGSPPPPTFSIIIMIIYIFASVTECNYWSTLLILSLLIFPRSFLFILRRLLFPVPSYIFLSFLVLFAPFCAALYYLLASSHSFFSSLLPVPHFLSPFCSFISSSTASLRVYVVWGER